jgi:hypothetical protein
VFEVGESQISCTMWDNAGNYTWGWITVYVQASVADQLAWLRDLAAREPSIAAADRRSLAARVEAARRAYVARSTEGTCLNLSGFVTAVRRLESDLDQTAFNRLVTWAYRIGGTEELRCAWVFSDR